MKLRSSPEGIEMANTLKELLQVTWHCRSDVERMKKNYTKQVKDLTVEINALKNKDELQIKREVQ